MELSEWEALTGNDVILYLRLLIAPDYAYNIARSFARIQENMKEETKIPKTLSNPSYISARLTKMADAGVITKKIHDRRAYFDINCRIFNDLGIVSDIESCSLDISEIIEDPSAIEPVQSTHLLNQIHDSIDPDLKDSMMKQVIKLKKFDYLTIAYYFHAIIIYALNKNQKDNNRADLNSADDIFNREILCVDGTKPDHYIEGISRYIFSALKAERFPTNWKII